MLDDELASPRRAGYPLKRALDIVGACAAILLFSPVMLAVAIAVALSSPGPIIFKQPRLGRRGVPFTFYKFRSMRTNNDDRIHREYVEKLIKGQHEAINQQDKNNPLYKLKADPRITRVGAFIRRTSLDELPQFFNVLKGDMSLVGPRPPLQYEAKAYQPWHLRRVLELKPGITGPWQVHGRSRVSFDDMVRMDIQYVQQASLRVDLDLLFRTAAVIFKREGAG
jgi:lipopolysaccharide/colanic/teichoic acid biosynthesis glycosyltransferase